MQKIIVQKVSANQDSATVGQWYAAEGDTLEAGDEVVELITEKANFIIEAEEDGVLLKTFAATRSILPIGYTVGVVGSAGDDVPAEIETENNALLPDDPYAVSDKKKKQFTRVKATPAARRAARKAGIKLQQVKEALGLDEVVTEKHVREYVERDER